MKKILIWILSIILLSSFVSAIDLCEQTILQNETCLMITPVLTCNSSAIVLNKATNTTRNITMLPLQLGIYQFNFSDIEGEYQLILCDTTTREIEVKGDSMLNDLLIVFLLIVIGLGFAAFGELVKNTVWHIFGAVWLFAAAPLISSKVLLLSGLFSFVSIGFFYLIGMVLIAIALSERVKNTGNKEDD